MTSIEINDFFFRLGGRVLNFGCSILPKNVHCSISFNAELSDVNFHFTKNTKNHKSKPQIKIVIIDKDILAKIIEQTFPNLFMNFIEPFDMGTFRTKYDDEVGFISFDNIENTKLGLIIKEMFINGFSDISKLKSKGTKLEIKGDINARVKDILKNNDESLIEMIFHEASYITESYEKQYDNGVIITHDNIISILRINGEWFSLKQFTVFEFLCFFVSRKSAYLIICKAYDALEKIKTAQSYADTEKVNYPIRIILSDMDLKNYQCPKCKKQGLEHSCYL